MNFSELYDLAIPASQSAEFYVAHDYELISYLIKHSRGLEAQIQFQIPVADLNVATNYSSAQACISSYASFAFEASQKSWISTTPNFCIDGDFICPGNCYTLQGRQLEL